MDIMSMQLSLVIGTCRFSIISPYVIEEQFCHSNGKIIVVF